MNNLLILSIFGGCDIWQKHPLLNTMGEENKGLEDFLSKVDQVGKYSTKEFIVRLLCEES